MTQSDEQERPGRGDDPVGTTFRILAAPRQRAALRALEGSRGAMDVEELLDELVERRPADREQLRVVLHHVALPRLHDAGVIEYEAEAGTVRYTPTDRLEKWLDHLEEK